MTPAIEVRDLHVSYGEVVAIDGLTFSLAGDKIYGLIGRNGSGKTTLLSVLAAFRKASSGSVLIDGRQVFEDGDMTSRVCLIRGTGDTLEDSDKVGEALSFAERMRPNWNSGRAAELIDAFGISSGAKIGALSRGQRAALGVTLGLASRAPVTMFDETYLGMDAPSREVFYDELLADFMAVPRTFIISSHLIEEMSRLFEEVVIIDHGRLVLHEEAEQLRSLGAAVTGEERVVDRFVQGLSVLNEKRLGRTKSVTVYGAIDDDRRARALNEGLQLEPVAIQDLFIHLTKPEESDGA